MEAKSTPSASHSNCAPGLKHKENGSSPGHHRPATDGYLTPMQQKDKKLQELRRKVKSLQGELTDRDSDIKDLKRQNEGLREKLEDTERRLVEMDKAHDEVTSQLEKLTEEKEEVESTLSKRLEVISELEAKVAVMVGEQEQREQLHQQRYLEIYQKGQATSLIEQEEELVRKFAMEKGDPLTQKLIEKLLRTERKLERMRDTKRQDVYKKGPSVSSEDHAKMGMLKSAVFYYLTGRERGKNLDMLMTLLEYSDGHREKIELATREKKGK